MCARKTRTQPKLNLGPKMGTTIKTQFIRTLAGCGLLRAPPKTTSTLAVHARDLTPRNGENRQRTRVPVEGLRRSRHTIPRAKGHQGGGDAASGGDGAGTTPIGLRGPVNASSRQDQWRTTGWSLRAQQRASARVPTGAGTPETAPWTWQPRRSGLGER